MRATVNWDGYSWVAVLDGGGVTQAKRLDQLPARLAEVVKLMTGQAVAPDAIELEIDYGDGLGARAAELRSQRAELAAADERLVAESAAIIRALRSEGLSLRDIAVMTGVSYQRVHQLTRDRVAS
ncbi:MAG: type II toxin-antitoxin system HicB family antitoxin [Acidimicrobiales bacterium]